MNDAPTEFVQHRLDNGPRVAIAEDHLASPVAVNRTAPRTIRPGPVAAVLAVVLLLAASGTAAETTAAVTQLAATASATALSVSGQATYASDEAVVVVDDAVGDSAAPVPATDIDSASITATTPQDLEFAITLADPLPVDSTVPGVTYIWAFEVSTRSVTLTAGTSTDDGEMTFAWQNCHGSGGDCSGGNLDGEYAGGVLTWFAPTSVIGVAGGSQLTSFGRRAGIFATPLGSRATAFDSADPVPYVVPRATVQLGVAPAGTAADDVVLDTVVTAGADGSFNATLPLAEGDGGVVAARACFDATCGAVTSVDY